MVSLANAFPEPCCELYSKYVKGDVEGAKKLHSMLFRLNQSVSGAGGVAAVKGAMDFAGYHGGPPRLPLAPLTDAQKQKIGLPVVIAAGLIMKERHPMKAWLLKGYNQPLEPIERNRPQPGPGEILLKVKACGLCYTDIKIIKGEIPPPIVTLPHVLGHEVAGEVVEIGQGVSGIAIGDLGVVYSYVTCHECPKCLTGRENICQNLRRVGFELDGGFSEYLSIPAYNFCPFSKNLQTQKMAILADAIGTPYHAITRLAQVKAGQDVLIVGAGGLGLHAVQIAKLCGARVMVVDMNPDALALAKTLRRRRSPSS